MIRSFIPLAALIFLTGLAVADEKYTQPFVPELRTFSLYTSILAEPVRSADVIFTGVSTNVDFSNYTSWGEGTYSGTIIPKKFLKGSLDADTLRLQWKPSATGIRPGSDHIFFARTEPEGLTVIKEIFVHKPPYMCARTYAAYDGGTETTLQTIRLLVNPLDPVEEYPATLLADFKEPSGQRQATAVMLACEVMRPEALDPFLFAITNRIENFDHAIYGACRLNGKKGTASALALLATHPNAQATIFAAISASKNPDAIGLLNQFGTEHPIYRVSCAFAIRGIDSSKVPAVVRPWLVDGKHAEIKHTFYERSRWLVEVYSANNLLKKALTGDKVFRD